MKPGTTIGVALTLGLCAAAPLASAGGGTLPNNSYSADTLYQRISPPLGGAVKHNQPSVVNGYLMLAGNARHELWDIHDPTHPELVSKFASEHDAKEAESHQVAFARRGDRHYAATISGKGIDLWDLTDAEAPELLSAMLLEGIDYGDNTNAVWGVSWQGRFIYVGGTNTGLHIVDASDPEAPVLVDRLTTAELGGVSAGPLFALGNLLVITTPKEHAGIATLDIGDPASPALLDFVLPADKSYIGGFYGKYLYLLTPFRVYDVTSDPNGIELVGESPSPPSEYLSFGDGFMFLGGLRPKPGVFKLSLANPLQPAEVAKIHGRKDKLDGLFTDDQFPLPIGNLLVMSDDEVSIGSTIAVHDTARDSTPPAVIYVNPPDGASSQPLGTRIGISFSDQIDLRSVDTSSVIVRPLGGSALTGQWGHAQTLVNFWPDEPLAPNTTYEIVIVAGGVRDLAGNAVAKSTASVFSTGTAVAAPKCEIAPTEHTAIGEAATLSALEPPPGASFRWDFGDGSDPITASGPSSQHVYALPGRYPVTLTVETPEAKRSCTAIQVAHRPLSSEPVSHASPVGYDAERGLVWTVNPDADSVTRVDAETLELLGETRVGRHPRTLAIAADGTLWVANQHSDDLSVLSPDGVLLTTLPLAWGSAPFGIAAARGGERLFVTLEGRAELAEIDAQARVLVRTIPLGTRARGLALLGERALVARFLSPEARGELLDVSLATGTVTETLELPADPGPDETTSGRGIPNALGLLAISPDGARAFVPAKKDNTFRGLVRDGQALNTDNTVRTIVSAIELDSGSEALDWRVDLDNHDMASAVVTSPSGDLVFVASQGTHHVDVLDAYTGQLVAGFSTGAAPQGLALAQGKLFVQCFMSRSLDVFDVSGLLAATDAAATRVASITTVESEPLADSVLFGKQLFYNAADPRMSLDGYLSCATCHPDAGDDGRVWDFSDRGEGLRNTIPLVGRAGLAHGPVHWTGNFDEIQDFENDIRFHFGGGGFMQDADFEAEERDHPLGGPKAGLSEPLDALAAYVASLDRFPRSPHRNPDGSLTPEAERGRAIFARLDCTSCHRGHALTDSELGVLHDVGTLRDASGSRLGEPLLGLDTPTLRGLWASAPYLHDGSAATLSEVLDNPLHGNAWQLPAADRDSVVAFLLQIENEPLDLEMEPPLREPAGGCACTTPRPARPPAGALVLALLALLLGRFGGRRVAAARPKFR